jgi:integrase/recombinase XerD
LVRAGANAIFAAEEFFKATLNNPHTKRAYSRAVVRFLAWCEHQGVELRQITPGLAGEYAGQLEVSPPTKNQALAALRHFFDGLVARHVVALNPFASVRGLKHRVAEGATPEISVEQARKLLRSLTWVTSSACAIAPCSGCSPIPAHGRLGDLRNFGEQRALRFREKGGKVREIPVRHDLDAWLRAYLDAAGVAGQDDKMPLFRAADGKRRQLTPAGYRAHSMRQMLKRRLEDAGLPHLFSPHSFRVAVVTDLLNQNVPLEDVQYLAGHSNPRTTQIYDRRRRRVTRNIVERISI